MKLEFFKNKYNLETLGYTGLIFGVGILVNLLLYSGTIHYLKLTLGL